jgi:asparagine synthase (glutamine-hydrolysing)
VSGFFGLLQRRGPGPDTALCEQLLAAQAYRGGDRSSFWHDPQAALGHSLLTTTAQLAREPQPFTHPHSGAVISADVRLDNRTELAAQLGMPASALARIGDAQLILEAWQRWGEDCPQYLLGDFAFTLWDPKRQRLFGARDHLGIKPFYYHLSDDLCMAASDTVTLLAHPRIATDFNDNRIADFFFDGMEGADLSSTFYNSLRRLPPAHCICVDQNKVRSACYWQPTPAPAMQDSGVPTGDEAFLEILRQAVACRLPDSDAAGVLLSGGVDSALVTSVAAGQGPPGAAPHIITYSRISSEPGCSETKAIEQLQQQLSLPAVQLSVQQDEYHYASSLAAASASCEPFDMSMTLVRELYSTAVRNGQRIMLDGVEGDLPHSLPTDYPASLLRQGYWLDAWRETLGLWNHQFDRQISLARVVRQSLLPGLIPTSLRRLRRRSVGRHSAAQLVAKSMINPLFAKQTECLDRLQRFQSHQSPGPATSTTALHSRAISHPFLAVALERYDRVAASQGAEARHPLLDKRLVELSLNLPWQQKVSQGHSKTQLRRAAQHSGVPSATAWAHTTEHLGWQCTERAQMQLTQEINNCCLTMRPALERYVRTDKLDPAQLKPAERWQLFSLALWLQRH